MDKRTAFTLLIFLTISVNSFAQNIYDPAKNSDSPQPPSNPTVTPSEFKSKVNSAAQTVSDNLTQELNQQIINYRTQHPVPNMTESSGSTAAPAPTPTPAPIPAPAPKPTFAPTPAPATPQATTTQPAPYTGFGSSSTTPTNEQKNPLYKPAPNNSGSSQQWNIRY